MEQRGLFTRGILGAHPAAWDGGSGNTLESINGKLGLGDGVASTPPDFRVRRRPLRPQTGLKNNTRESAPSSGRAQISYYWKSKQRHIVVGSPQDEVTKLFGTPWLSCYEERASSSTVTRHTTLHQMLGAASGSLPSPFKGGGQRQGSSLICQLRTSTTST